jgi:mannose-6-phosphate isomerase-like protein (cupin superfamily)
MTSTTPTGSPVDLFTHRLQLDASGAIRADERWMAGGDDTDWRLAFFRVETADDVHADHWEMHTLADEALCCLRGAIRVHLRSARPDSPDDVVHLSAGRAAIVPRGRWHRLELDEPTELLAVTLRRGTRLQHVSAGQTPAQLDGRPPER